MDDTLNHDDIAILLDATKALEGKSSSSQLTGRLMGMMLSRNKEDADELQSKIDQEEAGRESEQRRLEEKLVMVRAKLIMIRKTLDSSEADQVFNAAGSA